MKILKVIHGYPPLYNAGSEVYSQTLCRALVNAGHQVEVITREENPFSKDFSYRQSSDSNYPNIKLHMINLLFERLRYGYNYNQVNVLCAKILENFKPDIVHIGHLNHLSLGIVAVIKQQKIPIVYTIHDFWLMCPRGQFIQRNSEIPWTLCDGQDDLKCATQCYYGCYSGDQDDFEYDSYYWVEWINRRMSFVKSVSNEIDLFIAPSKKLMEKYINEFGLPKNKVVYIDYGFDIKRLTGRVREKESEFVFGYIGTHIPTKGIDLLIKAFAELSKRHKNIKLRIWGRPCGQNTYALQNLAKNLDISPNDAIEWMPEYANHDLINDVFNWTDIIVVPSIWQENSPLVIHEALQARVGVITADFGGMEEYVKDKQNGWTFKHRDYENLSQVMEKVLITNSNQYAQITNRGYLLTDNGNVIDIADQVLVFNDVYQSLINQNKR